MAIIAFCDIETTGVKVDQDRICELAMIAQDLHTGAEVFRFERKINPTVNITARLTAIHGIGNADVMGAPTFAALSPVLGKMLERIDFFGGHNFREFDAKMILHEFIRAGTVISHFPQVIDTLDGRWATPDGKMPTLAELCWSLDVLYDKTLAHRALYDVEVNAKAWRRGVELGYFEMPVVAAPEMELAA